MDNKILKLIQDNAHTRLMYMSSSKQRAFINMAYAGLRKFCDGLTVNEIADEVGYSKTAVSKYATRWKSLVDSQDSTVKNILSAYLLRKTRIGNIAKARQKTGLISSQSIIDMVRSEITAKRNKGYKFRIIDLELTAAEVAAEQKCVREAIKYMANIDKGIVPEKKGKEVWLTQDSASRYCGCSVETLNLAAIRDMVVRREYLRKASHVYYEYEITSLDNFIQNCTDKI